MYIKRASTIQASEIADYLNAELHGADFAVQGPGSGSSPVAQSLIYLEDAAQAGDIDWGGTAEVLVITPSPVPTSPRSAFILSANPRLDFAVVMHEFFLQELEHRIHPIAQVDPGASIERNVLIAANAAIGPGVTIGRNSVIMNNVVVVGPVTIGSDCVIKSNTVIGTEGYAFVASLNGRPMHVPQLGTIHIGDRVWIGANATVERSEIRDTIIGADTKIDDLVHIGGGSLVADHCMVTAGVIVGREVRIATGAWLAPGATVRNGVTIGRNVVVGQGCVVVKDLEANGVYVGVPARFLRKNTGSVIDE
ncbi:MAG: DapH/DapD/GlmU-related protein [Thermodesulfobacteriota bacterium]